MWAFVNKTTDHDKQILSCRLYKGNSADSSAKGGLVYLEFVNDNNKQLSIELRSVDHAFIQQCKDKIQPIASNSASDITNFTNTPSAINISIAIQTQIYWLNAVLDILEDNVDRLAKKTWLVGTSMENHSLAYFSVARRAMQAIVQPSRDVILQSRNIDSLHQLRATERRKENVMDIALLESAIASEARLRQQFDFPSPNYVWCRKSRIRSTETEFAGLEDYAEESDADINESHVDVELFSEDENTLIEDFIDLLQQKIDALIRHGHIKVDEARGYWLTDKSIAALSGTPTNNELERVTQNRSIRALNSITALRALQPNGSYSHNNPLTDINLYGYGLRNLVALLYRCCRAAKHDATILCPNTKYYDAIDALIAGIANGARGKNRQDDADNLLPDDLQVCIQGRYGALIAAFDTIFPGVNIVYNYREPLLYELKREVIRILIAHAANDLATATNYVNLWATTHADQTNTRYNAFVEQTKKEFPAMLRRALLKFVPEDDNRRAKLHDAVEREARECREKFNMTYIEMISISQEELSTEWQLAHRVTTNKRHSDPDATGNVRKKRKPRPPI